MNKEAIKTFLEEAEKKSIEVVKYDSLLEAYQDWCDNNGISGYAAEYLDLNKVLTDLIYDNEYEIKMLLINGDEIEEEVDEDDIDTSLDFDENIIVVRYKIL